MSGKPDLYECEVSEENGNPACHLKDLTVARNAGEHADVRGLLLGESEDMTTVYLVAQGILAENENDDREKAALGGDNLYMLHDSGGSWSTTFVATLSSEDSPEWEGPQQIDPAYVTARLSPKGQYLAFMSSVGLTGYDNVDQNSGAHDEEVYLYESRSGHLACVSCNPTGARPVGVFDTLISGEGAGLVVDRRRVWEGHWLAASVPGWTAQSLTSALYQSRYLSDEGRLFFDSADALVPQVTAGTREEEVQGSKRPVGVENVYEYEPGGVGSCEAGSGGCVSLISSGSSSRESAFLEATPNGNDVFFLTASQLAPQDTDTEFDIYDARVCSATSPCLTPPPPPPTPCDTAASCQPATVTLPSVAPSGSATPSGAGNGSCSRRRPSRKTRPSNRAPNR